MLDIRALQKINDLIDLVGENCIVSQNVDPFEGIWNKAVHVPTLFLENFCLDLSPAGKKLCQLKDQGLCLLRIDTPTKPTQCMGVDEDMSQKIYLMGGDFQAVVDKTLQPFFLHRTDGIVEGIVDPMFEEGADEPLSRVFGPKGPNFFGLFEIDKKLGKAGKVTDERFEKIKVIGGRNEVEEL